MTLIVDSLLILRSLSHVYNIYWGNDFDYAHPPRGGVNDL
jgi:hypothetical protein